MTGAEVILVWEQKRPRFGWSASFLRETDDGTLTEVFTVTRTDRTRLEESLRELWPAVTVVALEAGIPT